MPPMNVPQIPRIWRCTSVPQGRPKGLTAPPWGQRAKRAWGLFHLDWQKTLFGEGANIRGFERSRVRGGIGQLRVAQCGASGRALRRAKDVVGCETNGEVDVALIGARDQRSQSRVGKDAGRHPFG